MRIQSRLTVSLICLMLILANGASLLAQTKRQKEKKPSADVVIERQDGVFVAPAPGDHFEIAIPRVHGMAPPGDTFLFVSSEMSFDGKVVKGAPYSAQAVTESVQMLTDGNRIVRKNTASVYRDGEGRTRRDQIVGTVGPFAAAGDPPQTFFINDPVAGINYILDPRSRTARKMPFRQVEFRQGDNRAVIINMGPRPETIEERQRVEIAASDMRKKIDEMQTPGKASDVIAAEHEKVKDRLKTESLGKQMFEGVEAEGTRTTFTIPAGEIGNEQPINLVSERWYSPELQTVVMSKHSDPRTGETVYRLTNINRGEPARSLFEVPSDYTIKEGPGHMRYRTREPNEDK